MSVKKIYLYRLAFLIQQIGVLILKIIVSPKFQFVQKKKNVVFKKDAIFYQLSLLFI